MIFDKIIYINSKNRPDRLINMKKRIAALDLNIERFEAVLGGKLDHSKLSFKGKIKTMNNGEIGCFISHATIYQKIKDNGWKHTLILEDDALFCDDFLNVLAGLEKQLPEDWDMFFLGQWNYDHLDNGGNEVGGEKYALKERITDNEKYNLYKANRCWLTHAYAVNLKSIDYLIDNTKDLYSSIDNVLADIQHKLNVYAVNPNIIKQDGSKSSLR